MRNGGLHIDHQTLGIGIEMRALTVVPAQYVAHVGSPPAGQGHAPANTAVEPRLTVPVTISRKDQGTCQSIDIGVRGTEADTSGQLLIVHDGLLKETAGLVVTIVGHLVDGVDNKPRFPSTLPRFCHQVLLISRRLEDTGFVDTNVAVTVEFRIGDGTNTSLEINWLNEMAVIEKPHSPLPVRQCHHLQRQLGLTAPTLVTQTIDTHAIDIRSATVICRVKRYAVDAEADIAVKILLHHRKDRTITSFQAPVTPPAIKGTGEAVDTVHTDKATIHWLV